MPQNLIRLKQLDQSELADYILATSPQGPTGITGATGGIGPTGETGGLGVQGPVGTQGTLGPTGPSGVTGPQGASMNWGATGEQGAIGPTGPGGLSQFGGPTGPQGVTGPQGLVGVTGPEVPGPTGEIGPQGFTGPQGIQGETGSTGLTGYQGDPGDRYRTTSYTTMTIPLNPTSIQFVIEDYMAYSAGQEVIIAYDSARNFSAIVDSYDMNTGIMFVTSVYSNGTGSYSYWTVNLAKAQGRQGNQGITGPQGDVGGVAFRIGLDDADGYTFEGIIGTDPSLTLIRGMTYSFTFIDATVSITHPLFIKDMSGNDLTSSDGVYGNGSDRITFAVPYSAANNLQYVCSAFPIFYGLITISDAGGIRGATGAQGDIGITGPAWGDTGAIGATGVQGITGPTGPRTVMNTGKLLELTMVFATE